MERILNFVKRNYFISIIGKSGSGKTTLIKNVIKNYKNAKTVVLSVKPYLKPSNVINVYNFDSFLELIDTFMASSVLGDSSVKLFVVDDALNVISDLDIERLKNLENRLRILRAYNFKIIMSYQDLNDKKAREIARMSNAFVVFDLDSRFKRFVRDSLGIRINIDSPKRFKAFFIDLDGVFSEELTSLEIFDDESDPAEMIRKMIEGQTLTRAVEILLKYNIPNAKMLEILSDAGFSTTEHSLRTIKYRVKKKYFNH